MSKSHIQYTCTHCGKIYTDTIELISVDGTEFCGACADQFNIIDDPDLGFQAFLEDF